MFNWLILLIIYLPFQIALNPIPGFDLASIRVFIILLFLILVIRKDFKSLLSKNLQKIGLLFFLILSSVSLIGTENVFWGFRKILFFLSIFPLYFLIVALVDNWAKIKKVVLALVIASGLIALIGLIQFFAQFIFSLDKVYNFWAVNITPVFSGFSLGTMILAYPSWLVNVGGITIMRAFSFFSDPHMFSFYLGLTLPLVVVLLLKGYRKKLLIVIYPLLFIALLLTFTRGAYLAIIITFLVLAGLIWKYLGNKKVSILLYLSLLLIIIPHTPFSDRFYASFDLDEGSNMGRLEMWQQASQTGMDNFWQGVGLGNYSLIVDADLDYRNPVTAHNLYLDFFSEMGIFTLTVWLILILGTIGQLFEKLINSDNMKEKYVLIGLIGSLVYFLVHSCFETAIYNPSVLALLMVVLGLSTVVLNYATKN
ncbi:MAG: O-antigen ligase family protein [Candidatus Portnoybacteria bacterium]|nr:O-antigen ligase family protein [Candidatus Portnoybacteria bacterium]